MARRTSKRRDRQVPVQDIEFTRSLRLTLYSDDEIERMADACYTVMHDVGLRVVDQAARKLLLSTGQAKEGIEDFIHYDPDLVRRCLETVPRKVELYTREGKLSVATDSTSHSFVPGHNCVNILDHRTGEHRDCLMSDIANNGKVAEALPHIHAAASMGFPRDVEPQEEATGTVKTLSENTVKPIIFTGHDEVLVERIWTFLAEQVGGWDNLAEKPYGLDLTGPLSPLKLGEETCRRVMFEAERNLPTVCYPALFPGMSGPITVSGAVVQSTVETLGGLVLNQLVRPGAPIMSGTSVLPMDLRQADLAYGSPEYSLSGLGMAELLDYLGIPSWLAGGCSDSHVFDGQAAAEAASTMTTAALGPSSFIHNLGFLTGGRTGSLEMLVHCDEIAGWIGRFASGAGAEADDIGVDVIKRAAVEGAYLTDEHTRSRYMGEVWLPTLFQRNDLQAWQQDGAKDLTVRIREKLFEILGD